jgi:hypothetical protein
MSGGKAPVRDPTAAWLCTLATVLLQEGSGGLLLLLLLLQRGCVRCLLCATAAAAAAAAAEAAARDAAAAASVAALCCRQELLLLLLLVLLFHLEGAAFLLLPLTSRTCCRQCSSLPKKSVSRFAKEGPTHSVSMSAPAVQKRSTKAQQEAWQAGVLVWLTMKNE